MSSNVDQIAAGQSGTPDRLRERVEELAAARASYQEVKQIDETLFAKDYESL